MSVLRFLSILWDRLLITFERRTLSGRFLESCAEVNADSGRLVDHGKSQPVNRSHQQIPTTFTGCLITQSLHSGTTSIRCQGGSITWITNGGKLGQARQSDTRGSSRTPQESIWSKPNKLIRGHEGTRILGDLLRPIPAPSSRSLLSESIW